MALAVTRDSVGACAQDASSNDAMSTRGTACRHEPTPARWSGSRFSWCQTELERTRFLFIAFLPWVALHQNLPISVVDCRGSTAACERNGPLATSTHPAIAERSSTMSGENPMVAIAPGQALC